MSENVIEVTDEDFEDEVLNESGTIIVDFWAPWCGSCVALAPMFDSLADEFEGQVKFVKINTEDNTETPEKYNVSGLPTFLIFKDGEMVDEFEGNELPSKSQLRKMIAEHIEEESESEDDGEESESEPILLDKETHEILKELAEENDTTVIEEICNAFSYSYDDISDDDLEEVDVIKEKSKLYVVLPNSLYALLEEEATENESEVSDVLDLVLNEYLTEDDESEDEEDEDEEEEEI